jgi:hypothetical protein
VNVRVGVDSVGVVVIVGVTVTVGVAVNSAAADGV